MATDSTSPEFDILRDGAYFRAHEHAFMRDFPGKFVAVRGEEVVGVADTRRELLELIVERYGDHVYFFSREVCPESFLPPDEWIRAMY